MPSARVDIVDSDLPAQELEDLTQSLRAELLLLDVDAVTPAPTQGGTPTGARGVDAAEVGALLVALEHSLPLATTVVQTVRAWLVRSHTATRTVRVTVGDKSIELSGASTEQQNRLVDEFITALAAS